MPIHPLTGLSIWGLSSSSYPYKGYIVVDVTFPASVTGVEESLSILRWYAQNPKVPHSCPVIIGTNASFFKRLAALSQELEGFSGAHSLRIQTRRSEIHIPRVFETEHLAEQPEGKLKWMGPGHCIIPSRGEICTVCKIETNNPLKREIFVVDGPVQDSLPAGLFITPVILPPSAVEERQCQGTGAQ